jgi:Fe-S cluster assembly protein SufD
MTHVLERAAWPHLDTDLEHATALGGPAWLKDLRAANAGRVAELGFPVYTQENWRFTDITPILKADYRSILAPPQTDVGVDAVAPLTYDAAWPRLVLVDGQYAAALSDVSGLPAGTRAGSLSDAIATGDAVAQAHLDRHADVTNGFAAANGALLRDGVFVHVPDGVAAETPVQILVLSTAGAPRAAHPRILVVLGDSAELTTVETFASLRSDTPYFSNVVSEYVVGSGATLNRHKIVEEGPRGHHLESAYVELARDAHVSTYAMTLTGQIVRNELNVLLDGPGGNAQLHGLYMNDGDRLTDNFLHVTHAAPNCYSRMAYKGVLDGTSTAVFTGKVWVKPEGQKTDSNQLNNNLLLSDQATIDTKPQLEIFADDVKCTHGATIGGFPQALRFYFQSRGMTDAMAQAILTYGFASEIVDGIAVDALRARLSKYVFDNYSPKS